MDIMKRRIPGDVKLRLTYEEFTALLSAKMFEFNFELITEEIEGFAECRNLLRGVPAKKEYVRTQLEEVWGKNEIDKWFHKSRPRAKESSVLDYSLIGLVGSFFF